MRPVFTLLLVVLLIVLAGGAGVAGIMYLGEKRRHELASGKRPRELPAAGGERLIERTLRELRPGDVLTHDGKDFLVEGVVSYDEDGHCWAGGRIVDGADVRWLIVGIERMTAPIVRMLTVDEDTEISGYPPEALDIGAIRYTLDKRGTATCRFGGDVGGLAGVKGQRPEGSVERCRWWLYGAAGDDALIIEQWSGEYRVLRGKKVSADVIEMIAAS